MSTTPQWYADQCARKYARRLLFRTGLLNPLIPQLYRSAFNLAYRSHVKAAYGKAQPMKTTPAQKGLPEKLNSDSEGWIVSNERSISYFKPWNDQRPLAAELVRRYNAHEQMREACEAARQWCRTHSGWNTSLEAKLYAALAAVDSGKPL